MIQFIKRRARARLIQRLRTRYQQITPAPLGRGMFNFRCHENCVEAVRLEPDRGFTICEAIYVEDGQPVLHYLLRDPFGQYHDPTLGWRCDHLEFYLIRDLLPADHARILTEFDRSLRDWTEEFVGPLLARLLNIDRII